MQSSTSRNLQFQTSCRVCKSLDMNIRQRGTYNELVCLTCGRVNARESSPLKLIDKPKPPASESARNQKIVILSATTVANLMRFSTSFSAFHDILTSSHARSPKRHPHRVNSIFK
jgi:hypothetical protein